MRNQATPYTSTSEPGPGAAAVADPEDARQQVIEDQARSDKGRCDADGHGDEPLERAKGGVAVLAQVAHGYRPRVQTPEECPGHGRTGRRREGGVLGNGAGHEPRPGELQEI